MSPEIVLGSLLGDKASLAEATVRLMYETHRDMFDRYGDAGVTKCIEDTAYHIEFLHAALEIGDREEFLSYRAWLEELMASLSIPPEDIDRTFHALADTLRARYGDAASEAIAYLRDATP